MKWMPIESAPKRGVEILAICDNGDCHIIYGHYYSGGMMHEWAQFGGDRSFEPTHWMPLPEPPGSEPSLHDQAKSIMDEMTDEERLSLMQEYCVHCGTKHTPCYCTRDD